MKNEFMNLVAQTMRWISLTVARCLLVDCAPLQSSASAESEKLPHNIKKVCRHWHLSCVACDNSNLLNID